VNSLRVLPFSGVFNFRDLGGYPTTDGRTTRWGRLYRSDALHGFTQSDLELFRRLGINSIVDLRNPAEVERTGRGPLTEEHISFTNTSILSGNPVEEKVDTSELGEDYMWHRYLHYLDVGGEAFVGAFNSITRGENLPLVFNCFFGKDRTGVLAALVLSCLGVEAQAIVADYALTSTRVNLILEKLREDPVQRDTIERSDPVLLDATEHTMSRFLAEMDQRYGGACSWVLSKGVTTQQIEVLKRELLE
jgi:protein tyrosine/serine phosphatase